jgi:phosphohistidine phosphatase
MRTLFLVRHAKSSWDNPALRDFQRPLNERGLQDAPRMGKMLAALDIQPDLLVSSPAKRASTTAQFFAVAFGIGADQIVQNESIYEAAPRTILHVISNLPDTAQTVLLFGHNPAFTEVANFFTHDFIENVPTCGVVRIETTAESWSRMYEGNAKVVACYFPKDVL